MIGGFVAAMVLATTVMADETPANTLPGTQPLLLDEPLDVVMVRGIGQYAERELAASPNRRRLSWPTADAAPAAVADWRSLQRSRLRSILGVVDARSRPELSVIAAPGTLMSASVDNVPSRLAVRWSVLDGVTAEGVLLLPAGDVRGFAVAVPDASWTPEMFCGLEPDLPADSQFPRRLVAGGIAVLVPMLISRDDTLSGHPDIRYTNIPHRELLYRMSFEMGRHLLGYEVQKVLAAVDLFSQWTKDGVRKSIGVCGVGDGGQLALLAAALDERITVALVSGYFSEREHVWQEPIDRNIWRQLATFGDAEIAALTNGHVFIEAAAAPTWDGPKPARDERPDFAAPGRITTPQLASVRREWMRLQQLDNSAQAELIVAGDGHAPAGSSNALTRFAQALGGTEKPGDDHGDGQAHITTDAEAREKRQMDELIRFTQRLLHSSDKRRYERWADADASNIETWVNSTRKHRGAVHHEMVGQLDVPHAPSKARTRKLIDEPTHVGYEVLLDVIPGIEPDDVGIIAGGILLLPTDLADGEKRPVVVCQHGLEGTPMDTITTDESSRAWRAYKGFSTDLVQRGFIVYAPQNPYRGLHDFRVLQRKSNPMGRSLFSYMIEQHRQVLRWLATLPSVDSERIAFYGLSYGGKTAVRVPPLLVNDPDNPHPEYCLSICSADFNEWIRKNVSHEDRYSYVYTREYEMFEWNMGHVAGYAELATLMIPRPFMVERGHDDGVAPDEWVAWEYAKVRRRYNKLGIGERTEIEFFDGPHTINGQGTYKFLHRHLDWPEPTGAGS